MFLQRIQVPNFRALKDVDITFEPEFSPRIFPLGSLNGGGKSTLLQLIFILLSCSADPDKHIYIKNLLDRFEIDEDKTEELLAKICLFNPENNQDIELDFICHKNEISLRENDTLNEVKSISNINLAFSVIGLEKKVKEEILLLKNKIKDLEKKQIEIDNIQIIKDIDERKEVIAEEVKNARSGSLGLFILKFFKLPQHSTAKVDLDSIKLKVVARELKIRIKNTKIDFDKKQTEQEEIKIALDTISTYLRNKNFLYICNSTNRNDVGTKKEYALLCRSDQLEKIETDNLLKQLSNKVFLAAPFTQIFLFLPKDKTKLIFKGSYNKSGYYSSLEESKRNLPNLFTYDILSTDYIINFLKASRDKDFKQVNETGTYGDSYKTVLQALNSILDDKKINIDTDLSGVNFKVEQDGKMKELYPEDFSHGELKRLSIYVWLKYKEIQNSIVLMDEIENAFHPDWQYQIISDLAEWGASNQFILATHSYELCQALTPAHVKELEPKLMKENQV